MKLLLGMIRMILFSAIFLTFLLAFLLSGIVLGFRVKRAMKFRIVFCRVMPPILGIRLTVLGTPPDEGPCLIVSNHRSYVDPVAVLRDVKAYPVAKVEVSSWPLVGWGASISGILYVKREKASSRRFVRDAIKEYLKLGRIILIYPEGTTHTNDSVMPFRPATFQVAAELGVPIIPVAIEYRNMRDAFVGSDTFVPHFLRTFSKTVSEVKMKYGRPIHNTDFRKIISECEDWTNMTLQELRDSWSDDKAEKPSARK